MCWILSLFKHLVASGFLMCLFYPPRPKDLMQKMLFFFQLTDSVLGLCLPPTCSFTQTWTMETMQSSTHCQEKEPAPSSPLIHWLETFTHWWRWTGRWSLLFTNTWRNEYEGCVEDVIHCVTSLMYNVTMFEKCVKIHPVITILETYFHTNEWRCCVLCCITVSASVKC